MQLEEHLGWCTRQSLNFAALEFVSQCHNKYWMMFVCKAFFADVVAALQSLEEFEAFRSSLNNSVKIETTYWVCDSWQTFCGLCEFGHSCAACDMCLLLCFFVCFLFPFLQHEVFSVNQHASICGGFGPCPSDPMAFSQWDAKRRNSVTGAARSQFGSLVGQSLGVSAFALKEIFPLCQCRRKKVFNNEAALTELNKFDDLMRHDFDPFSGSVMHKKNTTWPEQCSQAKPNKVHSKTSGVVWCFRGFVFFVYIFVHFFLHCSFGNYKTPSHMCSM